MKMTPPLGKLGTLGTPTSEPPRDERELPEVSTADAAAFLATLATAIHASAQPSSDPNEAAPLEGASTDADTGSVFEMPLPEVEAVGESNISLGHHGNLEGTGANEAEPSILPAGVTSAAPPLPTPALTFEGSTTFDEYIAPALLIPGHPTTLAAPMSTPAPSLRNLAPEHVVPQGAAPEHGVPQNVAAEHVVPQGVAAEHVVPQGVAAERIASEPTMSKGANAEGARLQGPTSEASGSENLTSSTQPRQNLAPSSAEVAPRAPRQGATEALLPNPHEVLAGPADSPNAIEAQSKKDGRQSHHTERAPAGSEASRDLIDAPVQVDARRTDRQHDEAPPAGLDSPRSQQASDQAQSPDAVELATTNPERGALENSVADVPAAPVTQDATLTPATTATTTQAANPEAHSSSPSRLLEHLRASFPAAEVRISEGRAGETLVSMNHPDFGAVELNLQMTGNGIDIAARVDGAIAANLLRRSETSLRKTIHRRGLSLGRLRVERNQKHSSRRSERGIDLEA